MEVTSIFWWSGIKRYNRPLLVLTTESSDKMSSTIQIWSTTRGTGSRLFRCEINELERDGCDGPKLAEVVNIQFGRGLARASSGSTGPLLFCGASNGSIFGISYRDGRDEGFKRTCTLRELSNPIVTLAGDKKQSDFLAGSDEAGNIRVWSIKEELDRDGTNPEDYRCSEIYRYKLEDDFCCALGLRGNIVIAGHISGYVTFHDFGEKSVLASIVPNTKAITSIDTNQKKDLVLICGEDCRVCVLGFSENRGHKPVVYFSVSLGAVATGGAIFNLQGGYPRIALLIWEKHQILQYEYEKSSKQDRKQIEPIQAAHQSLFLQLRARERNS